MKRTELYKPGEKVPESMIAKVVGSRGGARDYSEVTVVEGEPFPPVRIKGERYQEVRKTIHKAKRK